MAIAAQNDVTSVAAIAAIGTSVGYEFLPTEVGTTCATRTRAAKYLHIIDKVRHNIYNGIKFLRVQR